MAPHAIVELEAGRLVVSSQASIRTAAGDRTVEIRKEITLAGDRLHPTLRVAATVRNTSNAALACRLGQEWSVMLLGGGGNPSAWYEVGGARRPHDGRGEAGGIAGIGQGNDWVGVALTSVPTPVADAWWAPIETVSNSDNGFERVYQGSALLFSRVVTIEPRRRGHRRGRTARHRVGGPSGVLSRRPISRAARLRLRGSAPAKPRKRRQPMACAPRADGYGRQGGDARRDIRIGGREGGRGSGGVAHRLAAVEPGSSVDAPREG